MEPEGLEIVVPFPGGQPGEVGWVPVRVRHDIHVIVVLTWRSDWSNKDVMTNNDGNPTDFAWLTAWEWYYYF